MASSYHSLSDQKQDTSCKALISEAKNTLMAYQKSTTPCCYFFSCSIDESEQQQIAYLNTLMTSIENEKKHTEEIKKTILLVGLAGLKHCLDSKRKRENVSSSIQAIVQKYGPLDEKQVNTFIIRVSNTLAELGNATLRMEGLEAKSLTYVQPDSTWPRDLAGQLLLSKSSSAQQNNPPGGSKIMSQTMTR